MIQPLPAGQHTVRRHNLALVLDALGHDSRSRSELAQQTGLTKSTVSSLVDDLIAQHVVVEGKSATGGPGRPSRPVRLNPDGLLALGLEINVDYLSAALVDLTGEIRERSVVLVDNAALSARDLIASALALIEKMTSQRADVVLGVGLAVPGVVGSDGTLIRVPNLPALAGINAQHEVRKGLASSSSGRNIYLENEANCGALAWLADRRQPLSARQAFVYVSGEIGVGAGIVVGGALFRGFSGFAGELGHVVVDRGGPQCVCGGRGCVEQYAGLPALLAGTGARSLAELSQRIDDGDEQAILAVRRGSSALGVGLSSLLNVLDVPLVVLGGVYAQLFAEISPGLVAELDRRVLSTRDWGQRILPCAFGAEAAVRGAAGMVIEGALSDPVTLLSRRAGPQIPVALEIDVGSMQSSLL